MLRRWTRCGRATFMATLRAAKQRKEERNDAGMSEQNLRRSRSRTSWALLTSSLRRRKSRRIRPFEVVVSYRGRRCYDRSGTPAVRSHRSASRQGGASSLRTRFSKHQFTQPQLMAVLCLIRYEDWIFREGEVRPGEHRESRDSLGLTSAPDFTTLYRFLWRLDDQTIDRVVGETVRRLHGVRRKSRRRARVAVDATGLAQGTVSMFFVRHALSWSKTAAVEALVEVGGRRLSGPASFCRSLRSADRFAAGRPAASRHARRARAKFSFRV